MALPKRHPRVLFRLAEVMAEKNKSIVGLSEESGVPPTTISDLKSGRTALPTDVHLVALTDALDGEQLIVVIPDTPQVAA